MITTLTVIATGTTTPPDPDIPGIVQEVDGFYYYYPPANGGCFAAHTLRTIADRLDQLNDTWNRQVEKELNIK